MSGYKQLTQEQRYQIEALLKAGHKQVSRQFRNVPFLWAQGRCNKDREQPVKK